MEIKESWIAEQAVNANALKNAKALVQSGKFVRKLNCRWRAFSCRISRGFSWYVKMNTLLNG